MLIQRTALELKSAPKTLEAHGHRRALLLYFGIATTMAILLSMFYIIKHHAFAFVDIGSDSFFQFLPIQIAEVRALHELRIPTWSFNVGFGAYLGPILDPIQSLAVLFPESWQLEVRLPLYFLKLILAGAFFFGYLRMMFEAKLALFGALAYAFSSYAMVNGQWDGHGYEVLQFAAYLYLLEGFLRHGGRWRAVGAGLVVGSGHVFNLYTFALLTVLYALARFALAANKREYLLRLVQAALWMLVGVLLLAPVQLPNVYYLLENPRVSGNYSAASDLLALITQLNSISIIGSEIAGFFGKDLLGTGSAYLGWGNYFEGPGFYVGILLLICIPQLLGPGASRREHKICIAGVGLTCLYVIWPALRLAANGLGFSTFRISTLWVSSGLLMLGLAGLRRIAISSAWRTGITIGGGLLTLTVCAIAYQVPQAVDVRQLICVLTFIAIYCAVLWTAAANPTDARPSGFTWSSALLSLFCLELLLFAIPPMLDRTAVNSNGSSQYGSYDDGTKQALKLIKQRDQSTEFFRIEKSYNSVFLCDALAQDYPGIKSYFFNGSSVTRFVDRAGIDRLMPSSANYFGSALSKRDVLDLLGVKYVLAHGRELDSFPGVEFAFSEGAISVYRNVRSLGFAHLHDTLLGEAAADRLNTDQRDAAMLHSAIVADPPSVQQKLDDLNGRAGSGAAELATKAVVHRNSDDDLTGEVSSAKAALLLVSIPFDPGWTARLDDNPAPTFIADYGLTGLLVAPGSHTLRMSYDPPWRTLGIWLALVSLIVLLAPSVWRRMR